ncbi:hypothetical protein B0H14DRAFT_3883783 [Mycena olivaceomarginata]|nr:hypothetical protein B0H14DRAFT_3883783 [Mycena olivaceomarginata]
MNSRFSRMRSDRCSERRQYPETPFLLARAQTPIEWLQAPSDNPDEEIDIEDEFPEDLQECLSNTRMSVHFRDFGKELGVTDPKSLEDSTTHHCTGPNALANVDSACGNLAGTFVNAFVNAGFGNDKLMVEAEVGSSWVYKNKEYGMMSATASLGLSLLWDADLGLSHVDKYMYSSEEYIKAGALLATGILNSGPFSVLVVALIAMGKDSELFFFVTAMYPRFLIAVNEELNSSPVTVHIGQALDVVGQAGKPRTISGF